MSDKKVKDWKKVKEELEQGLNEENENLIDEDEGSEGGAGEGENALEHPSYAALEEKLTAAEQLAHENWEKSARALAELENVRRRAERDVTNAHRYGLEKFIQALLPVADSLDHALQLADKSAQDGMHEGLELTMKLLLDALDKQEVQQLDPQGQIFNPQEHEAMSIQDVPGAAPNTVVTVFQKGYKLADRVIRPARVIVAKK